MTVQQSSLAVTAHFTPEWPPPLDCYNLLCFAAGSKSVGSSAHPICPTRRAYFCIKPRDLSSNHHPPPMWGRDAPGGGGGGFSRNRALWELKGLSSAPPIITRLSLECPLDGSVKKANKPAVSATYLLISSVSLNYSNVLNWIFHKKSNLLSTLKKKKR